MAEQEKKAVAARTLKSDVQKKQSDAVIEQVDQPLSATQESTPVVESELATGMVEQLRQLKQDLMQSMASIKLQIVNSQKGLTELGSFAKKEVNGLMQELTKLVNELKEDVSQVSNKHKEHLAETLRRSKENGLEAWNRVKQ
ncbi:hypothetical protein [Acinetobacter rudis]|uniref:Uncharacterized protein n=1 Tax=Acinetobacter rudis TaxID=632955 RepID=A0AAW8JAI8_9GAMM|nr:hypothetical protein [Acinetobacter rudis]MDQ8934674.1 hypothetical protein [Acinetobacter rudis]MDQ8951561.1 hypothetical protein [Acinetobacter rudis]MDQ9016756.1 hypothetical protein [Acinetobacter rudis]